VDSLPAGFVREIGKGECKRPHSLAAGILPLLLNIIRLLRELDVTTHIFGTDPISIAVSASDAARVPLFNPEIKSRKYRQIVSLAAYFDFSSASKNSRIALFVATGFWDNKKCVVPGTMHN
jgi:hypothetical protein